MEIVTSTKYFMPILIFFIGVFIFRQFFTYRENYPLKYILTPLVTASIVGIAVLSILNGGITTYKMFILMALIFSLIGDTLLMIVEVDLLKYGIVFFLSAHIVYIFAFSNGYSFQSWNLILLFTFASAVVISVKLVMKKAESMLIPLIIYMIVLATMSFYAFSRLNNGAGYQSIFVLIGSSFFVISDSTLAINAFVKKIPKSSVFTWLTYAPAQLLLALSCYF